MQMFDASKGLFHLFFSNDDDTFYTDSYIKTRLGFYLYNKLISMKYNYVYGFSGGEHTDCVLTCYDNISSKALEEKNTGGFLGSFFSGRKNNSSAGYENEERMRSGRRSLRLVQPQLGDALSDLTALMKRKSRVAVIMPIGVFDLIMDHPEIMDELRKINSRNYQENNRHIVVITSSRYAGESLRFFRPTAETAVRGNIFSDAQLFPELQDYFQSLFEMSGNFYIYDELKGYMGDKAVFYDLLTYEHIRRMVFSFAIHSGYMDEMSIKNINSLAAVIYAYYNSSEYRNNNSLSLPENPKRSLSDVEEVLRNSRAARDACMRAAKEFAVQEDPYKYLCSLYTDHTDPENSNFMIGSGDNSEEIEMLKRIKRICISRQGQCSPELDRAIGILSKPCADYAVSFSASSFRKKIIEITCKSISDELSENTDLSLVDTMLRGLAYYFNYFRSSASLRDEAVTAMDISFDFYKNIMYLAEKLSRAKSSRAAFEERLKQQLDNGDNASAESTRQYLAKTDEFIKNLERTIEHGENMLSSPITQANARSVISEMKYESNNLRNLEKEKEPEIRLYN